MDLKDLEGEFEGLRDCCLYDPQWLPSDVGEIVRWHCSSPEGYASTEQVIIVRLGERDAYARAQAWGLLSSSSDTTGHGCQCGTTTVRADTLHDIMRHLTDDEIEMLIKRGEQTGDFN
jgi:hypothetical protein